MMTWNLYYFWKAHFNLKFPLMLQPSTTALRAYDGLSTKAHGILLNVPISLAGKMVLIEIKVINTQLD